MRARDIKPGVEYAVRVPPPRYGGRNSTVERCTVVGAQTDTFAPSVPPDRYVYVRVMEPDSRIVRVAIQNVLATWEGYTYAQDYDAAHTENKRRDWMAEYDRSRAEFAQRWERGVLPAFRGIPCGTDRFETMDELLRDYFITSGSQTVTLTRDDIEQLARRLNYA